MSLVKQDGDLDNQTAIRLKKRLAEEFRAHWRKARQARGTAAQ